MTGPLPQIQREVAALLLAALDDDGERVAEVLDGLDVGTAALVISSLAYTAAFALTEAHGATEARQGIAEKALQLAAG